MCDFFLVPLPRSPDHVYDAALLLEHQAPITAALTPETLAPPVYAVFVECGEKYWPHGPNLDVADHRFRAMQMYVQFIRCRILCRFRRVVTRRGGLIQP